jgi:prepilin-type processing-associated H-X9-DG protein
MRLRRVDVIVVVGVVGVLSLVLFVSMRKRLNYGQTECIYNLKTIYTEYANYRDAHGKPVTQVSTNDGGTLEFADQQGNASIHFRAFASGEMPAHYLVCPLDKHVQAAKPNELTNTNLSYFLSVNPPVENARWVLSGNRNLFFADDANLADAHPRKAAWNPDQGLHGETGYVLFLDGSVTRADSVAVNKFFNEDGNQTNRIAIP